jgi:hypothetical protein
MAELSTLEDTVGVTCTDHAVPTNRAHPRVEISAQTLGFLPLDIALHVVS